MKDISIIGRLTKDCKVQENARGKSTTFSVAVDDGYGENKSTVFFGCSMYSDKIAEHLVKGRQVGVTGEFRMTQGNDGKTWLNVNAYNVRLLAKPQGASVEYKEHDNTDDDRDEIPF